MTTTGSLSTITREGTDGSYSDQGTDVPPEAATALSATLVTCVNPLCETVYLIPSDPTYSSSGQCSQCLMYGAPIPVENLRPAKTKRKWRLLGNRRS
jgi:hypothetical protein